MADAPFLPIAPRRALRPTCDVVARGRQIQFDAWKACNFGPPAKSVQKVSAPFGKVGDRATAPDGVEEMLSLSAEIFPDTRRGKGTVIGRKLLNQFHDELEPIGDAERYVSIFPAGLREASSRRTRRERPR
jgi:hypothetical protein